MADYCTETEVKELGGTYFNRSAPATLNLNYSRFITMVCNEINGWLSEVGVVVPVDTTTYTYAGTRLKDLACYGVLAKIEEAIAAVSIPLQDKVSTSKHYYSLYHSALGIPTGRDKNNCWMYSGYLENPRKRLFAGDSNIDDAFTTGELERPVGDGIWSYCAEEEKDIGIGFDTEF